MARQAPNSKRKSRKSKGKWLSVAGAAALIIIVGVILELTHTIHLFHTSTPPPPTGPVTKGDVSNDTNKVPSSSNSGSSSSSNSSNSSQKTGSSTPTPTAPLTTPAGVFVSDHHPDLSGQPAPNTMTSNCTTTPGASCQISFTMGSTVKSLPSKTTDAQGSVYWTWTLQSIGLTQGTWTIQATASNGSSSMSANDAQDLVVGP